MLFSDFLEQAGTHAAAKERIEYRHGIFHGMFPFKGRKSDTGMHLLHIFFLFHIGNMIASHCVIRRKRYFSLPLTQLRIQFGNHFFQFKITRCRKNDIIGMVILFVIGTDKCRIERTDGFLCTQNGHPQRAFPPDSILQGIMYQFLRCIVIHINFFCNDIPLLLHILLCDQRVQEHIAHHIQCPIHMLIQDTGMIAGIFFCRVGIDLPAQSIHFLCDLSCCAVFCSFEHHMLNIMGYTIFMRQFISGTIFYPDAKRNAPHIRDRFQCHFDAVVQCSDGDHIISPKSDFCFYHWINPIFYSS